MAQSSLARLEQARAQESEQALWARASDAPPAPRLKLCPEGFDVIAECKLHSPSAGDLSAHTTRCRRARAGVCAGRRVRGVGADRADALRRRARSSRAGGAALAPLKVPAMRKDFLVDPYQVMEARAAGAGGVLVIVRMLDRSRITALLDCAAMLKMFVLLEAFDAADLAVAQRSARAAQGARRADARRRELPRSREAHGRPVAARRARRAPAGRTSRTSPRAASSRSRTSRRSSISATDVALVGTTLMNSRRPAQAARRDARGRPRARDGGAHAQDAHRDRRTMDDE